MRLSLHKQICLLFRDTAWEFILILELLLSCLVVVMFSIHIVHLRVGNICKVSTQTE